jgi:hypothetical protein
MGQRDDGFFSAFANGQRITEGISG